MRTFRWSLLCVVFSVALVAAACDSDGGGGGDAGSGGSVDTGGGGGGGGSVDPDVGKTFTQSMTAAEGGSIGTESGVATLTVPAGALAEDTELTLAVGAPTGDTASAVYSFGPDGLTFEQPVTLQIVYEGDPGEGNEAVIAWKDGDSWVKLPGSSRSGVMVSAPVDHFSDFAIVITATGAVQKGECGELADTFSPCGGDVVGTWAIDTMCIYWDPDDNPLAGEGSPFEQCPDLKFSAEVDWVGTYTLDATTVTADLDRIVATMRWEIPNSCFQEGVTCAMLSENMEDADCTDDGTTCTCEGENVQGEGMQMVQSYEIEGTTFIATNDESGDVTRLDYCVGGDTVIFRFPEQEDGWETGDPEWMILERQ